MDKYGIFENCIFYSCLVVFGFVICEVIGGEGVDVVFNFFVGDFFCEIWECVVYFGCFIEIGKRDIILNMRFEMVKFEYNVIFSLVDFIVVVVEWLKIMGRVFRNVMDFFKDGEIQFINFIIVMGIVDVEFVFRMLQSGKIFGKVVFFYRVEDEIMVCYDGYYIFFNIIDFYFLGYLFY